jgi:hypothetical protein
MDQKNINRRFVISRLLAGSPARGLTFDGDNA